MTDPALISAAIVSKLQAIAGVVSEMEVASNIAAYEDEFPGSTSLFSKIPEMSNPGILVVWNGSSTPKFGTGDCRMNWFSLILKSRKKYTTLWTAIMDGIPTNGDGQPFRRAEIHPSSSLIVDPKCDRRTLLLNEQSSIDYFEVTFGLPEKGPDR